jgi:predicted RNase H-like nuclease (RuvC/YqgF family)
VQAAGIPTAATRQLLTASDHSAAPAAPPTSDDLELQIRELTNANLDLRNRLNEQRTEIGTLRQELDRLRQEVKTKSPQKPSTKKSPKLPSP